MYSRKVLIYLLFALGGAAALTYEVLWMREFRLVFGSSVESASAVLAAYFGGMAVGSWIGSRLAGKPQPLGIYGMTAIGIGLSALLVGGWLALYRLWYPQLYPLAAERPWLWLGMKLLLAALALGPPTIGIGLTLPLVVRAVAPTAADAARSSALLYAVNVIGATLGAALAGFVLPMAIGVANGIYLASAVYLLIGAAALAISSQERRAIARTPATSSEQATSDGMGAAGGHPRTAQGLLALVAVTSGFAGLALEVLYVRILSFRTDGSVYSFSLMLAIFLMCLALGSMMVSRFAEGRNLWRVFAVTQLVAMIAILAAPWLLDAFAALTRVGQSTSLSWYLAAFSMVCLATLGLPVVLTGIVLPATWKMAARSGGSVAPDVGRLVAWNTLASVAGSLVSGFVLLPWLGLGGSLLVVAMLYGGIALAGFSIGYRGAGRVVGGLLCLAVPVAWLAAGLTQFSGPILREGDKVIRSTDGAAASVSVIEHASGQRTMRMNQNYILGSSTSAARERRQGQLPLLLHPQPKRVAFIGVATGITASGLLDFPVERAVAVELVSEVNDAVRDFAKWNRSVADDPRLELVVEDGRNYFLGASERFDVIVSDLFIPWHAGSGDLYTVQHFRTVADRLEKGGIFAQWLPGYQLTVDELRTIVASMQDVFPGVALWRADFEQELPLVCVLGYKDGLAIDGERLAEQSRRLAERWGTGAAYLSDPMGTCMLYVAGDEELRAWSNDAPRNSDDFPYIEYATPASYFRHRQQDVAEMNALLGSFRPRVWRYPQSALAGAPIDVPLRAADMLHDALVAQQENRFDRELQCLEQLIATASGVPAVVDHVLKASARLRGRNRADRADALLETMCRQEPPPLAALIALAGARRQENRLNEAVELLQRAVAASPDTPAIRMGLLELLKQSQQHPLMVEHLQYLLVRTPDDPYLRLDLAGALDRQGKVDEARAEVQRFRELRLPRDQRQAWRYLRGQGLGKYIDELPPQSAQAAGVGAAPGAAPP